MNIVKAYSPMSNRPTKCLTNVNQADNDSNGKLIYSTKDSRNGSSSKLKSSPVSYLLKNHLSDQMDTLKPPLSSSQA